MASSRANHGLWLKTHFSIFKNLILLNSKISNFSNKNNLSCRDSFCSHFCSSVSFSFASFCFTFRFCLVCLVCLALRLFLPCVHWGSLAFSLGSVFTGVHHTVRIHHGPYSRLSGSESLHSTSQNRANRPVWQPTGRASADSHRLISSNDRSAAAGAGRSVLLRPLIYTPTFEKKTNTSCVNSKMRFLLARISTLALQARCENE